MSKVNAYKQMKVFILNSNGETIEQRGLQEGAIKFWGKENQLFYVTFTLKRRQIIESWSNQISRAMAGIMPQLNQARVSQGLVPFDYDTLAESYCFEAERNKDTDEVRLIVWKRD